VRYESDAGDIVVALTGESPINRAVSAFREPKFLELAELLRAADMSFTNLEGVCQDENYLDPPNSVGGGDSLGTHLAVPPWCIDELRWLGIKMVSTANNHALDFGEQGLISNIDYLQAARMPFAGTGRNLAEARAASYLDTPKGRVALLAAADWGPRGHGVPQYHYPLGFMAGPQSAYLRGRPGVSLLRHRPVFTLDRQAFDTLRRVNTELGFTPEKPLSAEEKVVAGWNPTRDGVNWGLLDYPDDTDSNLVFMDTEFELGDRFAMRTVPDSRDMEDILKWVRDARRMADWVIVSFHDHGATRSRDLPSDHAVALAHACIDNGADIYIGHGALRDRGIEIYQRRPILYSLGNFFRQNQTARREPLDVLALYGLDGEATPADFQDAKAGSGHSPIGSESWETAVVRATFEGRKLKELRIYPVDVGKGASRGTAGRPILADEDSPIFHSVLDRIQRCSDPFGTVIDRREGYGVVKLA
jgi:poly-gamma-glutamate capsule biosynthesis protein CapA/YwtB (metallophosphatase superfamily)